MTGFIRKALPVAAGLLLVATSAMAGLPDPSQSTVPEVMVGSCSATITEDTYTVVVRDINGSPVGGATVVVDFSTGSGDAGVSGAVKSLAHATQNAPTTVNCPAQTISQIADGSGVATFEGIFGGADNALSVEVSANGVPLKLIKVRSTDLDAAGDTDLNDLNIFRTNFFDQPGVPNSGPFESDYNDDGDTELTDLNIFRVEFFSLVFVPLC
jgi:hypothetical protein